VQLLRKMRGAGETPPPRSAWATILATSLAATALLAGLAFLTGELGVLLLLASFAPSALIVFAYPDSPFAQPRGVVLGHLIGSACGLAGAHLLPGRWWAAPLAVGLAIGLMKALRAVHPPACANPLIVLALHPAPWTFLLYPTLAGAAAIVAVGLLYHNLRRPDPWPRYWL
jgi:CBS-domain-containing membrane protein